MLIASGRLTQDALKDDVAVVTGGGRGIGYEAARVQDIDALLTALGAT